MGKKFVAVRKPTAKKSAARQRELCARQRPCSTAKVTLRTAKSWPHGKEVPYGNVADKVTRVRPDHPFSHTRPSHPPLHPPNASAAAAVRCPAHTSPLSPTLPRPTRAPPESPTPPPPPPPRAPPLGCCCRVPQPAARRRVAHGCRSRAPAARASPSCCCLPLLLRRVPVSARPSAGPCAARPHRRRPCCSPRAAARAAAARPLHLPPAAGAAAATAAEAPATTRPAML
nr:uncharacterized protein LOC127303162 [Lolium perenne]